MMPRADQAHPSHPALRPGGAGLRTGPPRTGTQGRAARRSRFLVPFGLGVLLLVACGGGGAATHAGGALATSPNEQMEFGVQMAQAGLWSEALFRFRQAARLDPSDPRLLNNLAVAYEATGRYEEALETYQTALELAPQNRELRRNYARFVEFYQSYRPEPAAVAEEPGAGGAPPAGSR